MKATVPSWFIPVLLFLVATSAYSQESPTENARPKYRDDNTDIKISWLAPSEFADFDGSKIRCLNFEGAIYAEGDSWIPYVTHSIPLGYSADEARVTMRDAVFQPLTQDELKVIRPELGKLSSDVTLEFYTSIQRKRAHAEVYFHPIRKNPTTGAPEKLVSYRLAVDPVSTGKRSTSKRTRTYKVNSVLRSGNWYRLAAVEEGVYKLTYEFLRDRLGMDVTNLRSDDLRLFGNGGGMLPLDNLAERLDDLEEIAVRIEDNNDGVFGPGDYLLFYGQSQHRWSLSGSQFVHATNYMADSTFYFVTRDYQIGLPKRIQTVQNPSTSPTTVLSTYDGYAFYERDVTNLIKSGRKWFGESFSIRKSYAIPFTIPNLITSSPVQLRTSLASRVIGRSSSFTLTADGSTLFDVSFPNGVSNNYADDYARERSGSGQFFARGAQFTVNVTFNNPSSADNGWLDYIEVNGTCQLRMSVDQLFYRSRDAAGGGVVEYRLAADRSDVTIWDVSDHNNVSQLAYTRSGNQISYRTLTNEMDEFVAFGNSNFLSPFPSSKVANQDLHSLPQTDYLIVVHPAFLTYAEQLADFHRSKGELSVAVVTTNQVYNEFSSGAQDITAIKSFMKMFYDRAGLNENALPKYLLLFGDASYDYKDRISGNSNFVPSYQSVNSIQPTRSYITDDYFGFLDDSESDDITSSLDIGIGRLPVRSVSEATNVVNKIIEYHETPSVYGPWRSWVTFVGDDEDGNIHMRDANRLATKIERNHPNYNVTKVMFDAYPQVSSPGGQGYPDVTEAINTNVDRGTLIVTYVGHGGETGWAHERVLGLSDVNGWTNAPQFPLFLTATCEFSRFDDPQRTSGGEFVLLNPDGGGIALLTTTRLVYSSPNYELSNTFMDFVFNQIDGQWPTLGDLLRFSKSVNNINQNNGVNYRNFALSGDPAMRLAYPDYEVHIDAAPDTIKALDKVTISGYVSDRQGQKLTNFNGVLNPTVFAQPRELTTLNNDGVGAFKFNTQTSTLFRGKVSVKDGSFSFSFVVPKDVNFDYGEGRISLYAQNPSADAQGNYEDFVIGGRSENAATDDRDPEVNLWLNDETFVRGGITDQNPTLYARVFDENGINTVGSGIGHDILAVLDDNTANAIVLNDYYESDLDSYQRGTINYPLSDLEEGRHTLSLKVWDVHNNSGEATTEFIVARDERLAIEHILNYPNPFTTRTAFYFDHNAPGQPLGVRIQIFTVSGKLVKTIDASYATDGFRVGPIYWDGRDQFGDKIGRGTYVYKVKVTAPDGESVEEFEKLVLLN